MKIAIVGGSAAGMLASLVLARAGHEVQVLDRDFLDPARDVEGAAASAWRPTAPQIVQPHIVMARCRELLRDRLPDVYAALLEAGIAEAPLATKMPATLTERSTRPGDERMGVLMTRRSTVDWVLRRAVLAEPGVTVGWGIKAIGLMARTGIPPHITGVRTIEGDIAADIVVDASGRRTTIDDWLVAIGARQSASWRAECGVTYYSRHYRLRPGAVPPGASTERIVVGLDEFTVGIWGADNGVMQMALMPLATDHRFRSLRHEEVFTSVMRTVPTYAAWLDALDPVTPVYPMATVDNTLRRLVVDGVPVVTGLHALGDAVCATNPALGRGLSLALWNAIDLTDVILRYPDDPMAQALMMDGLIGEHVVPYYEDQVAIDSARLAMLRHTINGTPLPVPLPDASARVTYAQVRAAAQYDPTAFRAFWTIMGMLAPPNEVYTDPQVVAVTHAALQRYGSAPAMAQPTRVELLAALGLE